ncbi:MAG: type II toxin-antitoxin system PemK/MazF family toxin [Candidatus Methanofastidiosa archaeon]|jgi:mRNA interferase MazF|nr:type II toxin-antitoxin system PemK/MazF family toxin [Candidatus Methanofastidiosa archaeon]HOM96662.1 type II toxin-antitoxin system PemK/MazF family toxin [Methanofastidiosum sp.]
MKKMTSGTTFRQREIVLDLFPFDDKNEFKKRPCIIVSNEKYNLNHNTFIAIPITSKIRNFEDSIIIDDDDLEEGHLVKKSEILPFKIFTINKSLMLKSIGMISLETAKEIESIISKTIEIDI